MPKRRVSTAAQRAASARNLVKARYFQSFSAPKRSDMRAYRKLGRTSKVMGSAAHAHRGGNVTIAPAAAAIIAGAPVTHGLKEFHPSSINGDIVQTRGTPYRPGGKGNAKPKGKKAKAI